jgi:trigger factor
MKANFISREINTVSMTMEVTAEEFENAINKVYKENKHRFNVPGFRKGKAPRKIIENNYGSGIFYEDAVSEVFNQFYSDALDEIGYEPVDHPDIDLEGQDIKSGNGILFKVKFLTEPEVKVENYKGVEVEVPPVEVTEKDIENQLQSYATRNARLLTVERPAKVGDTVILDYAGFAFDGEQFEGGTAENAKLKLGSNQFIPGFEDQLVGVSAGEQKDVEVKFPDDYPVEKLASEVATFKCTIHEVKEEELPEIDDDFAKECSEYDTLDEWKEELKKKLAENKEKQRENNIQNAIMDVLYNNTVIDIPEVMIEHEIDDVLRQFDQQLGYSGMNIQQYLETTHTEISEFRESIRHDAEKKVKSRLIVAAVANEEGIEVSEEDLDEELKTMGVQYGMTAERMREIVAGDIKYIKKDIAAKKALKIMADAAVVKDLDISAASDDTEASEE